MMMSTGNVGRRLIVSLTILLLVLSTGTWLEPVRAASATITLNFLGPDFPEYEAFLYAANAVGAGMGLRVQPNLINFDDVETKALLDFSAGVRTWDFVMVYYPWTTPFGTRKILLSIDDFLGSSQNKAIVNPSDFVEPSTDMLRYQGKLLSMPYLSAPQMLGYRSDLIRDPTEQKAFKTKYGYDLTPPQTYKQLLDIAQFFTREKGQVLAGSPLDDNFYGIVSSNKRGALLYNRYSNILAAFGADQVYNEKTMMPTWNSLESLAAATYYANLYKYMAPGSETLTGGTSSRVVAQGRAAMVIAPVDLIASVVDDPKVSKVVGKVEYVLMPSQVSSRPHATLADANGIGIYALSIHANEAFKLLAETLSTKGMKLVRQKYPEIPAMRLSVINDPEVKKDYPRLSRALNLFATQNPHEFAIPTLKEWPEVSDIATTSLLEALSGQMSVKQALDDGQARLVDLFKRGGYIK